MNSFIYSLIDKYIFIRKQTAIYTVLITSTIVTVLNKSLGQQAIFISHIKWWRLRLLTAVSNGKTLLFSYCFLIRSSLSDGRPFCFCFASFSFLVFFSYKFCPREFSEMTRYIKQRVLIAFQINTTTRNTYLVVRFFFPQQIILLSLLQSALQ